MFGDNASVITSSTIPHSSLNKRHNALSYHCVCEVIASNVLWFFHIPGKEVNPADVLTKFCGHMLTLWPFMVVQPPAFLPLEPSVKAKNKYLIIT